MWTICWDGSGGHGWDRFESRDDVINLANTLVREGGIDEDNILIFPPKADTLRVPYDSLEM